jgi:hypothetical protein
VIEAGGPKAVAELLRYPAVVAEHDPDEEQPALSGRAGRERRRQPAMEPIGEPGDATSLTRPAPLVHLEDDMDAVATEVFGLVEAVHRRSRRFDLREHL